MKTKTRIKSGLIGVIQHNQTLVRNTSKALKLKTHIKAGWLAINHNQTLLRRVR